MVDDQDPRKDAGFATKLLNEELAQSPMFDDKESFENAQANLVEKPDRVHIETDDGETVVWSLDGYEYQKVDADQAPETVNPSLWRQARLNTINGLFKIEEGFYQVRAFDMSNMTIIEAPDGLIIIDPLISTECARAALELYRRARSNSDPVATVIYTHSHVDHFGGVRGVVDLDAYEKGGVRIVAPDGFLEHAVSENVYAGVAMFRRAQYMYGPYLPQDEKGQVDGGLGKGQSVGTVSLIPPTHVIRDRRHRMKVAGMEIEFQLTPGAEAPAEMNFFFPDQGILCGAENITHNMHNLQTLRGARVRDPLAWSNYLNEAIKLFGGRTKTMFNQHHWPIWHQDKILELLTTQRDMFRYFNDQSLRMLNKGYTGIEIAEVFKMPPGVDENWSCRGYYGTVSHNAKAVYDRYMGWFNGNPCDLHPLPPTQTATEYVTLMGGPEKVLAAGEAAHRAGNYRWAAELLKHLVFHDEDNTEAKNLLADTLEQLGYQAEAATWRNFYLMGAQELRKGIDPTIDIMGSEDVTTAMTTEMLFDALAARLIGPKAVDYPMTMLWRFTDDPDKVEERSVEISNGALSHIDGAIDNPDVTVTLTRDFLNRIMIGEAKLADIIESDEFTVTGENGRLKLIRFFSLLDAGMMDFPIVTPRSDAEKAWLGPEKELPEDTVLNDRRRFLLKLPRGC